MVHSRGTSWSQTGPEAFVWDIEGSGAFEHISKGGTDGQKLDFECFFLS
jgi:hypothetical protein